MNEPRRPARSRRPARPPARASRGGLTVLREAEALRRRVEDLATGAGAPGEHPEPSHRPGPDEGGSAVVELASRGALDPRSSHPSAVGAGASRPDRPAGAPAGSATDRDPLGRLALFGPPGEPGPGGQLALECSTCRRETSVSLGDLVRLAFPVSIHLPFIRRYHSLMRCPACGRVTWLRLVWRR
ncbi:MAG: hypothetical protein HY658_08715 [Actinobacteria bacterium]|nr:hypothetical protein [Actinomycetota bacterium]